MYCIFWNYLWIWDVFCNQTWLAGKSLMLFCDFSSWKPPLNYLIYGVLPWPATFDATYESHWISISIGSKPLLIQYQPWFSHYSNTNPELTSIKPLWIPYEPSISHQYFYVFFPFFINYSPLISSWMSHEITMVILKNPIKISLKSPFVGYKPLKSAWNHHIFHS